MYGMCGSKEDISKSIIKLNVIYDSMPKTSGCESCQSVNGDNAMWCCQLNNPSMYYIEFINVWKEVQTSWDKGLKIELILRAVKNYLSNSLNKPCIFFQNGCKIYSYRPSQCRLYGIIPNDSWQKRIDSIVEKFGTCHHVRSQCDLVTTQDHMNSDVENDIFNKIRAYEYETGVSASSIMKHDDYEGSYRTFHDHLLLEILPESALEMMSKYRKDDITDVGIASVVSMLRHMLGQIIS